MAPKAKMSHATDPTRTGGEAQQRERLPQAASEQEIRRRAYEIYLERGAQPGHELEDWLQAERELTATQSNSPGGWPTLILGLSWVAHPFALFANGWGRFSLTVTNA